MGNEDKSLAVVEPAPATPALFAAASPAAVVEFASGAARVLSDVIERQKLYVEISGRRHVRVEGWTTCGALVGVFPRVEWCRRMDREDEVAYEARVSVRRTGTGEELSAAEAMCSSAESRWRGRDENAIRSMAQTRATSKALRLPLAWIVTLAGYDGTPAEEMEHVREPEPPPARAPAASPAPKRAVMLLIDRITGWPNRHAVVNGVLKHLGDIRGFTERGGPDRKAVEGALDEAARRTGIGTLDDLRQTVHEKLNEKNKAPPTRSPGDDGAPGDEMPEWAGEPS